MIARLHHQIMKGSGSPLKSAAKNPSRGTRLIYNTKLAKLRLKIDAADHALIRALAKRDRTVQQIGRLKGQFGAPILQKSRWIALMRDRVRLAVELGVDPSLVQEIFESIQKQSLIQQAKLSQTSIKKPSRNRKTEGRG